MAVSIKKNATGSTGSLDRMKRQEERLAWLFVLPVALGIIIFQLYPTIFSLYISLTRWSLITAPKWVGLSNYVTLFTDDRHFWQTVRNTLIYTAGTVLPTIALSIFFALLLNQKIKGRFIFRAIYFVPVVAPTVAVALLWGWLYEPTFGLINYMLAQVGIEGPAWMGSSKWALTAVIIMSIWQGLGQSIIIFLAGLQGISADYYEAAAIDGANNWQRFLRITLPLLSPTTFFVLVLSCIGALQVFGQVYVLSGPADSTNTLVLYLYSLAFRQSEMGLASALAYCVFIVIMILTAINFRLQNRWVFYED